MKKLILSFSIVLALSTLQSYGQRNIVINSEYKGLTYDEMRRALPDAETQRKLAEAAEKAKQMRIKQFTDYWRMSYQAFEKGDYHKCIIYSNYALRTGYEIDEIFYYRGKAFEKMGNKKLARREYKIAEKKGDYRARIALKEIKKKSR